MGQCSRLGFAVRIGTARPSVLKRYTERVETSKAHAREICAIYGYRDLHPVRLQILTAHRGSERPAPVARTFPGEVAADYGVLNDLARHSINLEKITTRWGDMTRDDGSPAQLGAALIECGSIAKTLHLLSLNDPTDRTLPAGHQLPAHRAGVTSLSSPGNRPRRAQARANLQALPRGPGRPTPIALPRNPRKIAWRTSRLKKRPLPMAFTKPISRVRGLDSVK